MEWIWKRLAHHVARAKLTVEFEGLSEEGLASALRQEALNRLKRVELVLANEELDDHEKVETLRAWFLAEE